MKTILFDDLQDLEVDEGEESLDLPTQEELERELCPDGCHSGKICTCDPDRDLRQMAFARFG